MRAAILMLVLGMLTVLLTMLLMLWLFPDVCLTMLNDEGMTCS